MNYPDYPSSGGPPYPQMPPGQGGAVPKPGGGTAITAGVLAVLGGLFMALASFVTFTLMDIIKETTAAAGIEQKHVERFDELLPDWFEGYTTVSGLGYALAAVLLLLGAVLLFTRSSVGRWMVVGGCVVVIGIAIAGFFVFPALVEEMTQAYEQRFGRPLTEVDPGFGAFGSTVFVILIPAVITLVLAVLPATGRWIAAKNPPPQPGPPGYQQPGQW